MNHTRPWTLACEVDFLKALPRLRANAPSHMQRSATRETDSPTMKPCSQGCGVIWFSFLFDTLQSFQEYDAVKIYYDNGQNEVTNVLHAAFGYVLGAQAVIYKECDPRHFRLQQIADYICEIELARIKYERSEQSKTEQIFFGSYRDFKKNHLRKIRTKRIR